MESPRKRSESQHFSHQGLNFWRICEECLRVYLTGKPFILNGLLTGGLEPPRGCPRQPLKLEDIVTFDSRPRNIEVGCHSSRPLRPVRERLLRRLLQILAIAAINSLDAPLGSDPLAAQEVIHPEA